MITKELPPLDESCEVLRDSSHRGATEGNMTSSRAPICLIALDCIQYGKVHRRATEATKYVQKIHKNLCKYVALHNLFDGLFRRGLEC